MPRYEPSQNFRRHTGPIWGPNLRLSKTLCVGDEEPAARGHGVQDRRQGDRGFPHDPGTMTLEEVVAAEPVYETLPGWEEDIREVRRMEDLPDNARRYVDRIETLVDVPAAFVSVGPGRDEIIKVSDPFTA